MAGITTHHSPSSLTANIQLDLTIPSFLALVRFGTTVGGFIECTERAEQRSQRFSRLVSIGIGSRRSRDFKRDLSFLWKDTRYENSPIIRRTMTDSPVYSS